MYSSTLYSGIWCMLVRYFLNRRLDLMDTLNKMHFFAYIETRILHC